MVRKFPKEALQFNDPEKEDDTSDKPTDTSDVVAHGELKAGKTRKKPRFHPGTVSLREIVRYQKQTGRLSARQTFKRNLMEILLNINPSGGKRISAEAVDMLHELTENLFVGLVRQANRIAVDNRRVTVMERDMRFVVDTMFRFPTLEQQDTL